MLVSSWSESPGNSLHISTGYKLSLHTFKACGLTFTWQRGFWVLEELPAIFSYYFCLFWLLTYWTVYSIYHAITHSSGSPLLVIWKGPHCGKGVLLYLCNFSKIIPFSFILVLLLWVALSLLKIIITELFQKVDAETMLPILALAWAD